MPPDILVTLEEKEHRLTGYIKPNLSAIIPTVRIFISCPVPASLVQPYSPSTPDIHQSVGAICSLSLPATSTHQL